MPDSPDTRRLVELTSHATDLSEASHTLELALEAGEQSPAWMPLTMHATTAYIRPFIISNVRTRLDATDHFPGIPAPLASLHQTIRTYRNTTVAHSQSSLAAPFPLALIGADERVSRVFGATMLQPMPRVIAEQFDHLIDVIAEMVEHMTADVVARLERLLSAADAEQIASWQAPRLDVALDADFSSARRRTPKVAFAAYAHLERLTDDVDPWPG